MRLRDYFNRDLPDHKRYVRSYEATDGADGSVLAHCDLYGAVESSQVAILDADEGRWTLSPNRKLMPSAWTLTDPTGQPRYRIERHSVLRLMNPLGRSVLALHWLDSGRQAVVKNLTDSSLDRLFGPSSSAWYLVDGERVLAGIDRRKRSGEESSGSGLRARLRRWLAPADTVLLSDSPEHLLNGAAFIALMLLLRRLTDAS